MKISQQRDFEIKNFLRHFLYLQAKFLLNHHEVFVLLNFEEWRTTADPERMLLFSKVFIFRETCECLGLKRAEANSSKAISTSKVLMLVVCRFEDNVTRYPSNISFHHGAEKQPSNKRSLSLSEFSENLILFSALHTDGSFFPPELCVIKDRKSL